jgi:hypothetical protein
MLLSWSAANDADSSRATFNALSETQKSNIEKFVESL